MANNAAIARLGIVAETRSVRTGAQDLDRLKRAAVGAAAGANQAATGLTGVNRQMQGMIGLARRLAAQMAAIFSVGAIIRAGDAWTSANNALRLITGSAEELLSVQTQIFDLAQRTASQFEATTGLYASIQRAAGDAIGGQREVLRLTETILKLANAGGGPAGSRNAALFQLRQLLQGSVVQAQEFNSLIDGTPLLVQAIADSIGVTRAELRFMVLDGELAVTQVIEALQDQANAADEMFARVAFTVGDAITRIQNAFQRVVGTNLGPILSRLVDLISWVAVNLEEIIAIATNVGIALAVAFAPRMLNNFIELLGGVAAALRTVALAHPFTAIAVGIIAVGTAFYEFNKQATVARHTISGFGEDMDETLEVAVTLQDQVQAFFTVVGRYASTVWDAIKDRATTAFDSIKDRLDALIPGFESWVQASILVVSQLPRSIIGFVVGMYEGIQAILADIPGAFGYAFTEAANAAITAIEAMVNQAIPAINWLVHALPGGASLPDFGDFRVALPRLENQFEVQGENVAQAFARGFQRGASAYDQVYETILGGLRDFASQVNQEAHHVALERALEARRTAEAAAQAAADAGDSEGSSKLREQIVARQELFDRLQAQIELSEREFEIYELTHDLLQKFPEFYAAQAEGAEDIAEAARAAAEADARRLDLLERQARAVQQQRDLTQANVEAQRLLEALTLGADEYDILTRTFELMDRYPDLYDRMTEGAEERARAEAEVQIALERQTEELLRQAERARDIAEAPGRNLLRGLEDATYDFWDNFVDQGFDALDTLGDQLKDVFRRLQADILRAVFDPVLAAVRSAMAEAFNGSGTGLFGGSKGGLGGLLGNLGGLFGGGGGLPDFSGSKILVGSDQIGSAGGGFNIPGLGGIGLGNIGGILGQIGMTFAVTQLGSGIANALGLVKKQKGGTVGGAAGGIIGSIIGGPIGGAIGSFIGSTIGGLFGPNESGHQAWAEISQGGALGSLQGGKRNENTSNMLVATFEKAMQAIDLIEELGGVSNAYLSSLSISEKHQSVYELRDRTTGELVDRTSDADIAARNSVGDPDALYNDAITALLSRTTFDNPVLQAVNTAMSAASKGADEILDVMLKLHQVLPDTSKQLSEWGEALKTLNETFDDLRQSTADVVGVAEELDDAFNLALGALRDQFSESIEDAILGIENPVALQFEELVKAQVTRLEDANALGADVTRVLYLNSLEFKQFIEQAGGSATAFAQLTEIFDDLLNQALATGQAIQPLIDAFQQAQQGLSTAFNEDVQDQLEQLYNPTMAAFKRLLKEQEERLKQAQQLGANITAVERLNALEQQRFFEGLNDRQREELAVMLDLIENFTGRISLVLGKLNDELDVRIDEVETLRQETLQAAERFSSFSSTFGNLRQTFEDRYGTPTPIGQLSALRERLVNLSQEGQAGNESALEAIPQVAQQIISLSRELYGSTTTFRQDFDFVQDILAQLEVSTQQQADELNTQVEALIEQRDLLKEIRDLLNQPDPAFDLLDQSLSELSAGNQVIADLLAEYLELARANAAQVISDPALIAAAIAQAQAGLTQGTTGTTPGTPVVVPTASTTTTQTADPALLQSQVALIDVTDSGLKALTQEVKGLRTDLKNRIALSAISGGGGAAA